MLVLSLTATRSASDIKRKEFNEWRALTFNLLFPGEARKINNIREIIERVTLIRDKIWKCLRRYVKRNWVNQNGVDAKFALFDIVVDAVVLNLDFKKQKPEFTLPRWKHREEKSSIRQFGYHYKHQNMENIITRNEERLWVELLVSPSLSKRGDSSGGNDHDELVILLKAQVICDRGFQNEWGDHLHGAFAPIFTMPRKQTTKQTMKEKQARSSSQHSRRSGSEDKARVQREHARISIFNDQSFK